MLPAQGPTMMASQPDAPASVYVARQPILYPSGRVFGYELLYRAGASETSCTVPVDLAAARVFSDGMLALGFETLTGGRPAFVNVTRQVLLADLATLLPRDGVVIELLESIDVDEEVISVCKTLKEQGYRLALDDYTLHSSADALLPFVDIVKVDMLATTGAQHEAIVKAVSKRVKLVAEKVESLEAFNYATKMGYHLFQGYYFAKPATFAARAVSAKHALYVRLLAELNKPNATVARVEDLIKRDAGLSYRVLRCINSAAFGIRRQLHSIRQALVLLGLDQVRKWASVWALAGLNTGSNAEIVNLAIVRARSCELVAEAFVGHEDSSEYFLLGLCSLLDAMLGRPMAEAVEDLPVPDDVRDALLGEKNSARAVLDAVIAYERGEWDEAVETLGRIGIDPQQLPFAYREALKWAHEMSTTATAA
jgi:c-di-GMP-related signal transduction protein